MLNLHFQPFPILTTGRLTLRRLGEQDAPALFALRSDPAVMRYIGRPLATSLEEILEKIRLIDGQLRDNNAIMWAITLRDNPALIGTICFWNIQKENDRAEIGYLLHPGFQGKGIMQEALEAAVDYGFKQMNLHSIEAHVDPGNAPSCRLLERNGFVQEAFFKENHFFDGRFLDTAVYSLLTQNKQDTVNASL